MALTAETNPFVHFEAWYEEAQHCGLKEPTALTLATCSADGVPSARVVLLKGYDGNSFIIYTNTNSRKGGELIANPKAALCFYWMPLARQVRVEGTVEQVSAAEADAYYNSRHRDSRIGAWASKQSQPMPHPGALQERFAEKSAEFEGKDVPRPEFWTGFRIIPHRVEFWQEQPYRMHDRLVYARQPDFSWETELLFP